MPALRLALVAPLVTPIREPQRGGSQAFVAELARGLLGRGHDVELYAAAGSEVRGVGIVDTGVDHRELAATLYRVADGAAPRSTVAERAFDRVYDLVRDGGYDVVHNHAFDAPAVDLATTLDAARRAHRAPAAGCGGGRRAAPGGAAQIDRRWWPASRRARPTRGAASCLSARSCRRSSRRGRSPSRSPRDRARCSPAGSAPRRAPPRRSPSRGSAGVEIAVYGDAYDADYAREQIDPRRAEHGVAVHAAVPQTALWEAMARAAVVLCPAQWEEPFGMVAAEAQACGTPVVAFRRGALPEVIVDGETGALVAPGDLEAAAEAVKRAPALSRRSCREHAERSLDIERSLDAHEALYERVAGARAGA